MRCFSLCGRVGYMTLLIFKVQSVVVFLFVLFFFGQISFTIYNIIASESNKNKNSNKNKQTHTFPLITHSLGWHSLTHFLSPSLHSIITFVIYDHISEVFIECRQSYDSSMYFISCTTNRFSDSLELGKTVPSYKAL